MRTETPYQSAVRWKRFWYNGMAHFGHLCALSLNDGDIGGAQRQARRYAAAERRFHEAWKRELVAERREGVRPRCVDWFGERKE